MKRSLLLLALILAGQMLMAEVFQIGVAVNNQDNAPIHLGNNYGWSKMLVTAAELQAAGLVGETLISGIGFSIYELVRYNEYQNQRIFLRHVGYNSYTQTNVLPDSTNATLVFSGSVFMHGKGWQQLTFDQPFTWDGTQNLEILWKNHSGVSVYNNPKYDSHIPDAGRYVCAYISKASEFPNTGGTRMDKRPILQLITPMKPEPALPIYPVDGSAFFQGSKLTWKSGGGCPSGYDVYFGSQNPPPLVSSNQSHTYFQPDTEPGSSYFWKIVPSNISGTPDAVPVWTFRTPGADALVESFEGSIPPAGWGSVEIWGSADKYPYHGTKYAIASTLGDTTRKMLYTPLLYIDGNEPLELFIQSQSNTSETKLQIKYSSDAENWMELGDPLSVEHYQWQHVSVDLSSLAGQNLYLGIEAFRGSGTVNANLFLDHVSGPRLAGLYPIPSLRISRNAGTVLLEWDEVPGAQGYRLYGSSEPGNFGSEPLELEADRLSYQPGTEARKFFRITAVF